MAETFPVEDTGFEMLPVDDEDLVAAADQLAAAEASLEDDPYSAQAEEAPIPLGRSWAWDPEVERFVRLGTAPVEVRGIDTLRQLIYATLRTAQGAHPIYSPAVGMEKPDDWIGEADPTDALATFEPQATDALTQIDRIEEVDELNPEYDPSTGTITIEDMVVITDEAEAVPLTEIELTPDY